MYFNVNFNVFFKLIKVYMLVSELYICNTEFAETNIDKYFRTGKATDDNLARAQ